MKRLFIPILAFLLCPSAEARAIYLNCSETEVVKYTDATNKDLRMNVPVFINPGAGIAKVSGNDRKLAVSPDYYTLVKYEEDKINVGAITIDSSTIYKMQIDRSTLEYESKYSYLSFTTGFVSDTRKSERDSVGRCVISKPKAENRI